MTMRAIRGAVHLRADTAEEMTDAVAELMTQILVRNQLSTEDLVSVIFTATPDLHAEFPAAAARALGLGEVPLLCAQELHVTGALPRTVRVLVHADLDRARADVAHVYLRGAEILRRDLAQ